LFCSESVSAKASHPHASGGLRRTVKGDQLREATGASSELFKEWRKHSGKMRTLYRVSPSFAGWTQRPNVKLLGFPRCERALDVLNVGWAARVMSAPTGATSNALTENYWVNVAQSVDRKPWGGPGCLTSNGVWYTYERDFCLDGVDTLQLQGYPSDVAVAGLTSGVLKELAGEAFFAGCIGTALMSVYLSPYASWWRDAGPA
jgi:hypothetical protein